MCKDSRQKHEVIAKNTKMPISRVVRYIKKFQQHDWIQFTLIVNPAKMGNFIPYIIFIEMQGELERTIKDIDDVFKSRSFTRRLHRTSSPSDPRADASRPWSPAAFPGSSFGEQAQAGPEADPCL